MRKILYIILSSVFFWVACSKTNEIESQLTGRSIEISFSVNKFFGSKGAPRIPAVNPGSDAERQIGNLYLFLFNNAGANPSRYYINAATFAGGTWNAADKKVVLDMKQVEAGKRQVYVVANIDATMKNQLDAVSSVAELQNVFKTLAQPWSTNIGSPLLMSGNATHNFRLNHLLDHVVLIRAVAKVELNIKLSEKFQLKAIVNGGNLEGIKYKYVNFDKNTYIVKPAVKPNNPANSALDAWPQTGDWTLWGSSLNLPTPPDTGAGYTLDGEKVTELRLITYLNERDENGAVIEIVLPRIDEGFLPPPEFGPELYRLPLPEKILRNHWYQYDVTI